MLAADSRTAQNRVTTWYAAANWPANLAPAAPLRSLQLPTLCTRRLLVGNTAWRHLWSSPPLTAAFSWSAVVWCASDAGLPDGVRVDEDSLGLQGVHRSGLPSRGLKSRGTPFSCADAPLAVLWQFMIFKITDDKKHIEIEHKGEKGASFEDFTKLLPVEDCRYAVLDVEIATKSGATANKLIFVAWCARHLSTRATGGEAGWGSE